MSPYRNLFGPSPQLKSPVANLAAAIANKRSFIVFGRKLDE
jgi:hypothetical protein